MQRGAPSERYFLEAFCAAVLLLSCPAAAAPRYKILYSFCTQTNCTDGTRPNGLVEDAQGNFYGTTFSGGAGGKGVIFELARTKRGHYRYTVLYDFCLLSQCADGRNPSGPLILDGNGNLYGLTANGGTQGGGAAFELVKSGAGWSLQVLYSFCAEQNCADGELPTGGLTYTGASAGQPYDGSSPLYGVTGFGGISQGYGTVFVLQPGGNGWQEQVAYAFCAQQYCADGAFPTSTPVMDSSGNLYGVTQEGGTQYDGVAFELSPNGPNWTYTNLYSFCTQQSCAGGQSPDTGLAIDSSGTLYGGTAYGGYSCSYGNLGCGVIFQLVPGTAQESVVHAFCETDCSDGYYPSGNVLVDSKGHVFGTTFYGGDFANLSGGAGTVVEIRRGKTIVLHQFCAETACTDGSGPDSLTLDPTGRLFGTTNAGGATNNGLIFQLNR